jgi:hypothetical protein
VKWLSCALRSAGSSAKTAEMNKPSTWSKLNLLGPLNRKEKRESGRIVSSAPAHLRDAMIPWIWPPTSSSGPIIRKWWTSSSVTFYRLPLWYTDASWRSCFVSADPADQSWTKNPAIDSVTGNQLTSPSHQHRFLTHKDFVIRRCEAFHSPFVPDFLPAILFLQV